MPSNKLPPLATISTSVCTSSRGDLYWSCGSHDHDLPIVMQVSRIRQRVLGNGLLGRAVILVRPAVGTIDQDDAGLVAARGGGETRHVDVLRPRHFHAVSLRIGM